MLSLSLSLQYLSGEEEEEDEEDEEGGSQRRRRRRRLRKTKKKASIYDVYEPSELERGFFTDKDKDIRVTDMPERFQVPLTHLYHLFSDLQYIHVYIIM